MPTGKIDAATQTDPILSKPEYNFSAIEQKVSEDFPFGHLKVRDEDKEKLHTLSKSYVAVIEIITTIDRDRAKLVRHVTPNEQGDFSPEFSMAEAKIAVLDLEKQRFVQRRDDLFKEVRALQILEERNALRN